MSTWLAFSYEDRIKNKDRVINDDESDDICEQGMIFMSHPGAMLKKLDVLSPFVIEYYRYTNIRPKPKNFRGWIVRLFPWLFPIEAWGDCNIGYWEEGSTPFDPNLLLKWAKRWGQIMDFATKEDLKELLFEPSDFDIECYRKMLENYQKFAEDAINKGKLLKMYVR